MLSDFLEKKIKTFWEDAGLRRYFHNTGWLFIGQASSLLASFLAGVLVIRYLGPEDYGRVSYAIAIVSAFSFLASLGLDSVIARELVRTPESVNSLLGTSFILKILGGLLAAISSVAAVFFIEESNSVRLMAFLFSLTFLFQASSVIQVFFQAEVRSRFSVYAQLFAVFLTVTLKIIFICFHLPLVYLMLIYLLDSFWLAGGLFFMYHRQGGRVFSWFGDRSLARRLISASWPLMFSSLSVYVYMKIDQIMIGRMLGETAVGQYAAAVKVSESWYFLPVIICSSLFPAMVRAVKNGREAAKKRMRQLYIFLFLISFLGSTALFFISSWAVILLFGSGFLPAIPVLKILSWSGVGVFIGTANYNYLAAKDAQKLAFYISSAASLLNIALNFLFIPRYGINGAAIATISSYYLVPLASLFWQSRQGEL